MASKKKKADEQLDDLPEGYEKVNSAAGQCWAKVRDDMVIEGKLVARIKRRRTRGKGSPYFYQIELIRPFAGAARKNQETGETEEIDLQAGDVVCIDEREGLKDLEPLARDVEERGAEWQVYIKALNKMDLDNGNEFWRFKLGKQCLKSGRDPEQRDRQSDRRYRETDPGW